MNLLTRVSLSRISVLWALALMVCCHPAAFADRPNVILIVADDQGYGDMGCHGHPLLSTPNLDRLRAEGVRLEDFHVDPVCTPTRAALMTGRYCTRVGAWTVTEGRQLLSPSETTMAEVFAASGYRTAMFGKWHLGDAWPFAPHSRGFQEVVCHRAGGVDEIGNPFGNDYFDDIYFRNGAAEQFPGYCTDVWFREATRFIRSNNGASEATPFFIYLPTNAMHSPHTVAERYSMPFLAQGLPEKYAKFLGQIINFDENLGRLLSELEDLGIDQNTLVVFMGDNGSAFANVGTGGRGNDAGMRGKKGSVYDGGHRVACFARWPAGFPAGHEVQELTSHRDWLPTLIELCELEAPEGVRFDGQSLVPLLKNTETAWPSRTMVVERQADQIRPGTLAGKTKPVTPFAVLTERWRLVNGELYEITTDPQQLHNRADEFPDIVEELYASYRAHFEDVMSHRGIPVAFPIGIEAADPVLLTVRDWHPTQGRVIWRQDQLFDDELFINGWWAIDVERAGSYRIRLSRFPADALHPVNAQSARLKIGDVELDCPVAATDEVVEFNVALAAGTTKLQTWFHDRESQNSRGAYFVTIEAANQE